MTAVLTRIFLLFFYFLCSASISAHNSDGLIASFYFSGDCKDNIRGIEGKSFGATLTHDRFGNANAAYCLDGNDDYINLGSNRDIRQQCMTISLWVKVNDFKKNAKSYQAIPILATRATAKEQFYEAYIIGITSGSHKFFGGAHSAIEEEIGVISSGSAFIDKWQHLVYMFDNDSIYLYVDGKFEQKTVKGFLTSYLIQDSVLVGKVSNYLSKSENFNFAYFNGCVDDVKFFNRLLSPPEILELHKETDPHVEGPPEMRDNREILVNFWKYFWYWPVLAMIFIVLLGILIRMRLEAIRRRGSEKKELQQQLLQSELRALRSQMNPHFIFNAINSIQHYVLTNEKDLANKYLVKFSKLMRNILDLSKEELISLKEELETVRLYLEIEALRFNNSIEFSINCEEKLNVDLVRLPPLLIQPFVENAIWHGLLLKEGKKFLIINITKQGEDIIISIDDNGIGRLSAMKFRSNEFTRKSLGIEITNSRIDVVKKVHGLAITYDLIDKYNPSGESAGTTVILKLHPPKET